MVKEVTIIEGSSLGKKPSNVPMDVFPDFITEYCENLKEAFGAKEEYLLATSAATAAAAIGNCFRAVVKNGLEQPSHLYVVLVGSSGSGKSPVKKSLTLPLLNKDAEYHAEYIEELKAWEKEKKEAAKNNEEPDHDKPNRTHLVMEGFTMEGLIKAHSHNKQGLFLVKDEIKGWVKTLNQYRKGDDLEKFLSIFDGDMVKMVTKTSGEYQVNRTCVTILGGIQPGVLKNGFLDGDNSANGFWPRLLFAYPENLEMEVWSDCEVDPNLRTNYCRKISELYEKAKRTFEDTQGEPLKIRFSEEAKELYKGIWDEITEEVNTAADELSRSILTKFLQYIIRFALIIEVLDWIDKGTWPKYFPGDKETQFIDQEISKLSLEKAHRLYKFFRRASDKVFDKVNNYSNPIEDLPKAWQNLFGILDKEFQTKEAIEEGQKLGLKERCIQRFLKNSPLVEKIKRGYYRNLKKELAEQAVQAEKDKIS